MWESDHKGGSVSAKELMLFFFLSQFYLFIYLLYNIVLVLPYIDMNQPRVYMCSPSWTHLPLPSPSHPSGSSQCTDFEGPVSCIELGLVICFTYGSKHISMLFSQIIPPCLLPQCPEVCSLYLCLFCCLAYRVIITIFLNSIYIYTLIYCVGVFLNDLLHFV